MRPNRIPWLAVLAVVALALLACAPALPTGSADPSEPGASPVASGAAEPSTPSGVMLPADLRYQCGDGASFSLDILDDPAIAELEQHPSAQALRDAFVQPAPDFEWMPGSGYWLIHLDDTSAEFLAQVPDTDPPFAHAMVEVRDGRWQLAGWGQCRPRLEMPGLSLASWTLDPDAPAPDATSTELPLLVNELACTGGVEMGPRLLPPTILERDDAVLIVFAAIPLEGDAFECPGNPSTRVVVRLSAPLGDRVLRDAGTFPPLDPTAPAS